MIVSCEPKQKTESQKPQEMIVEKNKQVFFKWPKDGSTVASPVFIDMGLEGMIVEPAGKVKSGFGHHHLLINQKFWPEGSVIPTSDTTLHYGQGQTDTSIELDPGTYILSLQFADGVHASYGEKMSATIKINVE
tara:strand:- start:194 stop:595 length:402 start_codon:yes stop_codon:yes gene_type:complete